MNAKSETEPPQKRINITRIGFLKSVKNNLPKINIDESEFDQSKYLSRAKTFIISTNPLMCFKTRTKISAAANLLNMYKSGKKKSLPQNLTERDLWAAKRVVSSCLHPVTGKRIPIPFRMCAFVPMNMGIVVGIYSARSVLATVFWQAVNQTYNVCVNFVNRGTGTKSETREIFRNYVAATTAAAGSAVGLNTWIARTALFTPAVKNLALWVVPWVAVSFANVVNISITRLQEISRGTTVMDSQGRILGLSRVAGRKAVAKTILSRVSIATLIMGVTPVLAHSILRVPAISVRPHVHLPIELCCSALVLAFALPMSLALFRQKQKIRVDKLEKEFQNVKEVDGSVAEYLYFNKGL